MQPPSSKRADGNKEVCDTLEKWLETARQGQINYLGLVACVSPVSVTYTYVGATGMEFAATWALDELKQKMREAVANRVPLRGFDQQPTADRVCFNLASAPINFDWIVWLIICEMRRKKLNAPAPLKVGFFLGHNHTDINKAFNAAHAKLFFDNVMRPSMRFIDAHEDDSCVKDGMLVETYTCAPIVKAYNAGEEIPLLKPSKKARRWVEKMCDVENPVTITLRESEFTPHRNSNVAEWIKFAEWLEQEGERVVFVRDTAKAGEGIPGFTTLAGASVDIDYRLALYESAKCNLFVGNGPAVLALFGTRPWLMFTYCDVGDPYLPNTPAWWREYHGIGPDQQYPWCNERQRIVWQPDTFENMVRAWQQIWSNADGKEAEASEESEPSQQAHQETESQQNGQQGREEDRQGGKPGDRDDYGFGAHRRRAREAAQGGEGDHHLRR